MPDYKLSTSLEQDAVLTFVTDTYNKEHDLALSNTEMLQLQFLRILSPHIEVYKGAVAAAVQTKFSEASPELQAQVLTLLGAKP
jgi:hypothetical protein